MDYEIIKLNQGAKMVHCSTKHQHLRLAPEMFMRITQNWKSAQIHYGRIKEYLPRTGTVLAIRLTKNSMQM